MKLHHLLTDLPVTFSLECMNINCSVVSLQSIENINVEYLKIFEIKYDTIVQIELLSRHINHFSTMHALPLALAKSSEEHSSE